MDTPSLFPDMDGPGATGESGPAASPPSDAPVRLRRAERSQMRMISCSLDDLLPFDHQARTLWRAVHRLDLSPFEAAIVARGSEPGRPATDPRVLITLWLYATCDGVGSGREVARLCEVHDAYRWIVGGLSLNYHTINDFRVEHEKALDDLFTQTMAVLLKRDVIQVQRIAQDGVRIRANAGSSSFRTQGTLEELAQQAREHVEQVKQQNDPALSAQQQAKRQADAEDRAARLEQALEELPKLQAIQQASANRKRSQGREARISTTDPEARVMKMADGGYRPGYNVQLAADPVSRAIVGYDVTNDGRDNAHSAPMREQIEQRSGQAVKEHLYDGGFVSLNEIDKAEQAGVTIYAPVPKRSADPHARKRDDTDHTYNWRQRMATDEAKAIYKQRGSTIETINGDLTQHRGLRQMPVRGSPKARCIVLWMILTYNLIRFADELTR